MVTLYMQAIDTIHIGTVLKNSLSIDVFSRNCSNVECSVVPVPSVAPNHTPTLEYPSVGQNTRAYSQSGSSGSLEDFTSLASRVGINGGSELPVQATHKQPR